jgi:UDP-2,3-diacylglucosamine hydrolase
MAALRSYTASGRACFFARGNRDFLIGAEFCAATGVHLLDEPAIADIVGERVLLLHGDVLCTDDHAYQAFRRRVRNPRMQALFLALPLAARRLIAGRLRRRSQILSAGRRDYITDVNSQTVAAVMRAHGVRMMLHGHTHRPAVHQFELDGTPATRIVLGDWYAQGSVLRWSAQGYELYPLPFPD